MKLYKTLFIIATLCVGINRSLLGQDSVSLRISALNILDKKDTSHYSTMATRYLKVLKNPFIPENLKVLVPLTVKTTDSVYLFLMENYKSVLKYGNIAFLENLKWKIYETYIIRFDGVNKSEAQWEGFINEMNSKYGAAGKEIAERFYLLCLVEDKKQPLLFEDKIIPYLNRNADRISTNDVNQFCWAIFEHSMDKVVLEKAVKWIKSVIVRHPLPEYFDTYANLLYKSGKKNDALKWEQEAVNRRPADKALIETLRKMQEGIKTW